MQSRFDHMDCSRRLMVLLAEDPRYSHVFGDLVGAAVESAVDAGCFVWLLHSEMSMDSV